MSFFKPYDAYQAKRLLQDYQNILDDLTKISNFDQRYRGEIKICVDNYRNHIVKNRASSTSVEELSKFQSGIKVKALMDEGYYNIGQLRRITYDQLMDMYGIGQSSADKILKALDQYWRTAPKNVSIRLSLDDKNPLSEALVSAIYRYRNCKPYVEKALKTKHLQESPIKDAIKDLTAGNKGLWFLKSAANQTRTINAFQKLQEIDESDYRKVARTTIDEAWRFDKVSSVIVWDDFAKDSIAYVTTLEQIVPNCSDNGVVDKYSSQYTDNVKVSYDKKPTKTYQETEQINTDFVLPDDIEEINLSGLKCTLRRYQENGVKYIIHQKRVMLGDEMGLGKTIQAIAAMTALYNEGYRHFLVICPTSVLINWCREIAKHSSLTPVKIHGPYSYEAVQHWKFSGGVAVTTYETTGKIYLSDNQHIAMVVVDEAHYIKNPNAQRSQNTIKLAQHADRLLFMTGTPLENKVEEMIKLIKDLRPDIASKLYGMTYIAFAPEFRQAVAPVYLRRKREDVLNELPELIEYEEWCTMGRKEEAIYESTIMSYERNYMAIRRLSWNVDELKESSKARRLLEIVEEAKSEGRKVLVFSFFLDTISNIVRWMGDRCMPLINGSVSSVDRQAIIDAFENAPAGTILPAQIMAGGTGLNIQSASVVVICEPQYKPSTEEQAISRAYRMGQTRNVIVYRLLCENTIEERMLDRLKYKSATFDAYADESISGKKDTYLDDNTFGLLVQNEKMRIAEKNKNANLEIRSTQE